jgi:hypothetical protein
MSNQGRALISALNRGDYQAVDQYSDLGDQDVKIVNHHVHELFERAIRTENFKLFLALIKVPRVRVSGPEYCALRHAVKQGLVEFVSEIVRVPSVNPNLPDRDGYTSLILAVRGKWSEKKASDMVRAILLIGGVKLNLKGTDGMTALHHAMEKEWYEVAEMLVDAGAHPKISDKDGNTALSKAMMADCGDLFTKMLTFDGDPPEEEADEFEEDDSSQDPASSAMSGSPGGSPGITSVLDPPPARMPTVNQIDPQVGHKKPQHDPPAQKMPTRQPATQTQPAPEPIKAQARNTPAADTADLAAVLEEQELDETLTKHYLFESATDDPRIRLHRRAVVEQLDDIQRILTANNNALQWGDLGRKDPHSGMNFWHVAALEGRFEQVLRMMMQNGGFPDPATLGVLTPDGRGVAAILDENSALQGILHSELWEGRAPHLAAFLSGLPVNRRAAFGSLIARTNLALMHGG